MSSRFQVSIRGAQKQEDGVATLKPNTRYWIDLTSEANGTATVIVDDVIVADGIAVKAGQKLALNRPIGTKGSFTFGYGKRALRQSLVKVKFTPDKEPASGVMLSWFRRDWKDSSIESAVMPVTTPKWNGATTLRGKSKIHYGGIHCEQDAVLDHENAIDVELRLVAAAN